MAREARQLTGRATAAGAAMGSTVALG